MSEQSKPNDPNINFLGGFKSSYERVQTESEFRASLHGRNLSFGISYLDDALGGIYPNDLVLLGAKTGFGKTQVAVLVALENIKKGKRVHFFALEAEPNEIERRLKYQMVSDVFFKLDRFDRPNIHLNYMDWYCGKFISELSGIEKKIDLEFIQFKNLVTYYREGDFNILEFERLFMAIKDDTDLIIVDHLHYFDSDDENENRAIKTIVKKIRDCSILAAKPVLLLAHVRKSDPRFKKIIPDIEDFHGSSDIGKIATKVITLAPQSMSYDHSSTLLAVMKCRVDGRRVFPMAITCFDQQTHRYESDYFCVKLDNNETVQIADSEIPKWALRAKRL